MTEVKSYQKNPVIIEAIKLENEFYSIKNCFLFVHGRPIKAEDLTLIQKNNGMDIETLEGTHHASWGDYIIKGIVGEFYPCKPDIFEKTYTEVNTNVLRGVY